MFTIRLPLHREDQAGTTGPPAAASPTVSSPSLNGVRLLLLDRDQDVREVLSAAVRQRGASVCLASTVDEALEMLESWRPDVLVSDAEAPDRDACPLVSPGQERRRATR